MATRVTTRADGVSCGTWCRKLTTAQRLLSSWLSGHPVRLKGARIFSFLLTRAHNLAFKE